MKRIVLPRLEDAPDAPFPPASNALSEPEGLLAMGGDLSAERLLNAYRRGIFPWYSEGEPILWWCPDPRVVFRTDVFRLSSRFRRSLRHLDWTIRADTAFEQALDLCASLPRRDQDGTWITPTMRAAYLELHRLGHAHSIEVFSGDRLAGVLYGVAIGRMFYGESMASPISGGSKIALAALASRLHAWGWPLIDGQVENRHLIGLGAERWPRTLFLRQVAELTAESGYVGPWTAVFGTMLAADLA